MSTVLTTPETSSETTTVLSPETRPAPRASLRKRRPASQPRWDIWLILLGTLVVWAFCVGMFLRQGRYRVATTPIAEMQLGANVPGVNPGEADDLSLGETIDPATWRKVSLTGRQTDGSLLEIELLRPLAWVDAHRIDGSDRLLLHMGELDFHGEAQLTAIDPCPPVRAGPGRTVTGLFRHHAHDVLDLYTTDGAKIGVTPNHRFWSADRNAFISTDRLRLGETLKLRDGQTRVSRISRRATGEPVYNLEVQVSHVFHVAESGILVHNNTPCDEFVTIAHGTSARHVDSIKGGLDEAVAKANSLGGRMNQPGSFHTHVLGPPDAPGEGLQLAYEWGLRQGADSTVMIGKIPKETFDMLKSKGLVQIENVGVGEAQYVFKPEAYSILNDALKWTQVITP